MAKAVQSFIRHPFSSTYIMSQSDLLVLLRSSLSSSASMPTVSVTKEEILLDLEKCVDKGLPYVKNLQKRIKDIINQLLEKELSAKGIRDL